MHTRACTRYLGVKPCSAWKLSAYSWNTWMKPAPMALRLASGSLRPCSRTQDTCTVNPTDSLFKFKGFCSFQWENLEAGS
jgi:hypothetical protein